MSMNTVNECWLLRHLASNQVVMILINRPTEEWIKKHVDEAHWLEHHAAGPVDQARALLVKAQPVLQSAYAIVAHFNNGGMFVDRAAALSAANKLAGLIGDVKRFLDAPAQKSESKPCRSPYCECDKGKCTHPGFYDARGEGLEQHTKACMCAACRKGRHELQPG